MIGKLLDKMLNIFFKEQPINYGLNEILTMSFAQNNYQNNLSNNIESMQ